MVQPYAVLEVAYRNSRSRRGAVVGLQFQGSPHRFGDEAVIAVGGEEGQLGTGPWAYTRRTMSRTGAESGSFWKGV